MMTGVTVSDPSGLSTIDPIWPKIWRRLDEYFRNHQNLDDFLTWLDAKGERVDMYLPSSDRHSHELINVEHLERSKRSKIFALWVFNHRSITVQSPFKESFSDFIQRYK